MSAAAAKTIGQENAVESRDNLREQTVAGSSGSRAHALAPDSRNSVLALQRKAGNRAVTNLLQGAAPAMLRALSSSPGEPLPSFLEAEFSRKFGHDLRGVSIHRDGHASEAARRIGANAFARGNEVFFREGAFQPEAPRGQALLAHELAHVVQQTRDVGSPVAGPQSTEAAAATAAHSYSQGSAALSAGPSAPVGVAADNGVTYEDDQLGASVLATHNEALDTVLDNEAEAQKRREETGVTDIETGHIEDTAYALRSKLAPAPVKKSKGKKAQKPKAPAMPTSSPDLRDASEDEIRAHRRALLETELATTDPADREVLGRDIGNTSGALDYAANTTNIVIGNYQKFGLREHQVQDFLQSAIPAMQGDMQDLENEVYTSNKLRAETSSWVTGPVHFWGGAWDQIETSDFAKMNVLRGQAAEAMKRGHYEEAVDLLRDSSYEYDALLERFGDYQAGIQKGGGRMVKLFSTTEKIARGTLNVVNPLAGAVYSFGQDSLQQEEMVRRDLQDHIDWWGNAKGAVWGAIVGKVSGGAAGFAGKASQPFLGGLGSQATSFLTGLGTASVMTGTNPVDVVDPTNLAVALITHGYRPGVGTSEGLPETGPSASVSDSPAAVPETPLAGNETPAAAAPAVSKMAPAPAETTPATKAPAVANDAPAPAETAPSKSSEAKPETAQAPEPDARSQDIEASRLELIGERRKMAKGGGLVDPDFKAGPGTKPKPTMQPLERTPGRSRTSSRVKQSQRSLARKRFGKVMQAALLDEGQHTSLTQLTNEHMNYSQRAHVIRTGELPSDLEFHHFLSVADFPEFAGLAESGAGLPEDVHRQAAHGGDTTRPLEAATMIDPGAEQAPPFNEDPLSKKGARPASKRSQIVSGEATSSKARGGVDADARIAAENALETLRAQRAALIGPYPRLDSQIAQAQAYVDSLNKDQ